MSHLRPSYFLRFVLQEIYECTVSVLIEYIVERNTHIHYFCDESSWDVTVTCHGSWFCKLALSEETNQACKSIKIFNSDVNFRDLSTVSESPEVYLAVPANPHMKNTNLKDCLIIIVLWICRRTSLQRIWRILLSLALTYAGMMSGGLGISNVLSINDYE